MSIRTAFPGGGTFNFSMQHMELQGKITIYYFFNSQSLSQLIQTIILRLNSFLPLWDITSYGASKGTVSGFPSEILFGL